MYQATSKLFTGINAFTCANKPIKSALLLISNLRMRKTKHNEITSLAPDQHQWANTLLPESILKIRSSLNVPTVGPGCSDPELWGLRASHGPRRNIDLRVLCWFLKSCCHRHAWDYAEQEANSRWENQGWEALHPLVRSFIHSNSYTPPGGQALS